MPGVRAALWQGALVVSLACRLAGEEKFAVGNLEGEENFKHEILRKKQNVKHETKRGK